MSRPATDWAFDVRGLAPEARHILLQIAHRHNGQDGQCNPSIAGLARDTGYHPDTVRRQIAALRQAGLIDVIEVPGRSNHFVLHMDRMKADPLHAAEGSMATTPPPTARGQAAPPPPVAGGYAATTPPPTARGGDVTPPPTARGPLAHSGGDPLHTAEGNKGSEQGREQGKVYLDPTVVPSPSNSHRTPARAASDRPAPSPGLFGGSSSGAEIVPLHPPRSVAIREADAFDRFWLAYPRKTAKGAARAAWDKAIRKTPGAAIVEALHERLPHFPEEPRFVPHPATWLNQERWRDEIASLRRITEKPKSATAQMLEASGVTQADIDAMFGDSRRTTP